MSRRLKGCEIPATTASPIVTDEHRGVSDGTFDAGFDGHRRRQASAGRALTHAQRLQWLEDTVAEMRRLLGRARGAARVKDQPAR